MGIKRFKPVTKTLRFKTMLDFSELLKKEPEKSLLAPLHKTGGRNARGRITSRRRGGGHKQKYRIVDFTRNKVGISSVVVGIEYDPNRSARIALLKYADGERAYILSPAGLKTGDVVISGSQVPIKTGNAMPLGEIPAGTDVHNIELVRGKGAQIARSAGSYCTVMAKEGDMVQLRLPSGEIRIVHNNCFATIGQVGNADHENVSLGKAGRTRWLGRRPKVRGVLTPKVKKPGEGRRPVLVLSLVGAPRNSREEK